MTKTLDRGTIGTGPEPATVSLPRENAGKNLCLTPPRRCVGEEDEPEQEESLVADARSGLTPPQMVNEKLAALLGAASGAEDASGDLDVRRTSGSREGAGPAHRARAAQTNDAALEPR
jgi:hypothetical protein